MPQENELNNIKELEEFCQGEGAYCCPHCYTWYKTSDEKKSCLESHGYEYLDISPPSEH